MRGFFKNDKLNKMYVAVNAESIYFQRDSGKVTGMQRSLSSRIRIMFKNNKVDDIIFNTKPDHRYGPLNKFTEDDKVLKGFLWKPKERPVSKESIIPSHNKKPTAVIKPPSKDGPTLINGKPVPGGKTDSLKTPQLQLGQDTIHSKADTSKLHSIKTGKDTIGKATVPVKLPAIKAAAKDTVKKP
jgi:hypothetical protein